MAEDQARGTPEDWPQSTSNYVLNEQGDSARPASASGRGSSASPPPFFKRKRLMVLLLAALIVLGGGGAVDLLLVANRSSFPSNIPLPAQSTLVGQEPCPVHCWYATVANTTCGAVLDFYIVQLPRQGWSPMKHTSEGDPVASFELVASQGDTTLNVSCANESIEDVSAPSGGVVLLLQFP